jgi:hypothetical protein
MVRLSLKMLHQKITASKEAVIFIQDRRAWYGINSQSELYGIPTLSGMALAVRLHSPSFPFDLDSIHHSVMIPYRNRLRIPYTALP